MGMLRSDFPISQGRTSLELDRDLNVSTHLRALTFADLSKLIDSLGESPIDPQSIGLSLTTQPATRSSMVSPGRLHVSNYTNEGSFANAMQKRRHSIAGSGATDAHSDVQR